jgi:hypothetical protein
MMAVALSDARRILSESPFARGHAASPLFFIMIAFPQ